MALHLVRHAEAGRRSDDPDDEARPLTARGLAQAEAIGALLGSAPVREIRSSRYLRCRQTVEPLADRLRLPVADDGALAEEARIEETWALLEHLAAADGDVVLCSHGNVLQAVLARMHRRGVEVEDPSQGIHKGGVWTVVTDGDGTLSRVVVTAPRA